MTIMPHPAAYTTDPDSICGQLARLGLLPEGWDRRQGGDAGTTIELSNTSGDGRPRLRPRRQYPGVPVLHATASEDGKLLRAWCVYCRTHHQHTRHGWRCWPDCSCLLHASPRPRYLDCTCPPGAGDGPRSAFGHCKPGSPFRKGGYVVVEVAK